VLMPFSTAFYSEYIIRLLKMPAVIYASNIIFLGAMNFILWAYINNPKHKLVEGVTPEDKKYFRFRAVIVPLVFLLMAVVYLTFKPIYAIWIPIFIPLIMRIFRAVYFRKKSVKKNL
jgi:uncharacterized membrane protein